MSELPEKKQTAELAEKKQDSAYVLPYIDIYEEKDSLYIIADMPGVAREDIKIDLKDDILTIQGKVAKPTDKMLMQEYRPADYYRSFTLTEEIDQEKISAKVDNGVLTLELPKAEKLKARKIEIKTG